MLESSQSKENRGGKEEIDPPSSELFNTGMFSSRKREHEGDDENSDRKKMKENFHDVTSDENTFFANKYFSEDEDISLGKIPSPQR